MRVLVTGAGGYLGQYVVSCFLDAGHNVRALLRPPARDISCVWSGKPGVEVVWADLLASDGLSAALAGVDLVVHLAATVLGDEDSQFNGTVLATERLLESMVECGTARLLLASSFSVYGFRACRGQLDEQTELEQDLYRRGGYAIAKTWQERTVRSVCRDNDIALTILRPGFIWGLERPEVPGLFLGSGRLRGVLGIRRQVPLTFVENCAFCFLLAAEYQGVLDADTYNIVDTDKTTAWTFARDYLANTGQKACRFPVPFLALNMLANLADRCRRLLFGEGGRLPSLLEPSSLAVFKPLRFDACRLYLLTGRVQPHCYHDAWQRTVRHGTGTATGQKDG